MLNENTAGAVTELELGEAVIPAGVDAESITVPVNPPRLPTLIVVDPEEPGGILTADGLAETEKSGGCTTTVTVTVWVGMMVEKLPDPVAVTLTT